MAMQRAQLSVTRIRDHPFDPVYTIFGGKGRCKASAPAPRRSCLFRSCANYESVFSDRLEYPRHALKLEDEPLCALGWNRYARFRANLGVSKRIDVDGEHRHLFFRRPVMPFLKPTVPKMRFQANLRLDCESLEKAMEEAEARCCGVPDRTETKETQTDYRESEAQTSPWTPPCRVRPGESPEVLTIAHLTWGHGLPAGMHEVEIINRMRMKRAWEAILPPMDSKANIETRTKIIQAMEIDDWAFREAEIQFVMDMRMELMEKYTKSKEEIRGKKLEDRYDKFEGSLAKRRDEEVKNIRQRLGRELRKLATKHRGGEDKWARKCDEAKGVGDAMSKGQRRRSLRFGENAKHYHEIINRRILNKHVLEPAEQEGYANLPTYSQLKAVRPKQRVSELCVRETRWNDEKLRKLHAELKSIRMDLKPDKKISLMKRRYKLPPMPATPILYGAQNINEKKEQAAIFIQKLVTGRAVQCVMFEGRDRCRELIEELQSTHWLQLETKKLRQKQKRHVIGLQRDQNRGILQEDRLSEILNMLEGMTLAGMLDFLSKELVRLKDERKAHAFALLAERERAKREAEEAGRRQLEEQRRREHDEMFRQIVKVDQDSVELYLEDIIKESIEWVSEAQAREYILETADKVDKISRSVDENARGLAEEEMVSDMIYNFVLPDVEKQIVRKRMRKRQESYLRNAHQAIYNKISELPATERSASATGSKYTEESGEEGGETEAVEERNGVTTADSIKERIIIETISPGEALAGSVSDRFVSRSAFSDGDRIAGELLRDIIKEVEARVEKSQLSISISARSSASVSSGSSYSSESGAKPNAAAAAAARENINEETTDSLDRNEFPPTITAIPE